MSENHNEGMIDMTHFEREPTVTRVSKFTASTNASVELLLNHTHRPQTRGEDTGVAANLAVIVNSHTV